MTTTRRDQRQLARLMGALAQDTVFAARQMRRARGFTALVILTFAVGIGTTTAVFSVVDHALLRPLPFPDPGRLVSLRSVDQDGNSFPRVSEANGVDWRERSTTLSGIGFVSSVPTLLPVVTNDAVTQVEAADASGNLFQVLGAAMLLGRPFTEEEAQSGALVAVVSERYWRRELGSASPLTQSIRVGRTTYEVIGVVRNEHALPSTTDLWFPQPFAPGGGAARNWINWFAIARLAPGRSIAEANLDLDRVAAEIRQEDPEGIYSYGVDVRSLHHELLGDSTRLFRLLLAAAVVVLVIVCANVASANLARGTARARELAVRGALGAGRARLMHQLLMEQVLLAVAGGALGMGLAWVLVRAMVITGGDRVARLHLASVDGRVIAAGFAIALVAGILSGLAPALRFSRNTHASNVARGGRSVTYSRHAGGVLLLTFETALAVVLLAGAGLLIRSMNVLLARDLGFASEDVVSVDVSIGSSSFAGDSMRNPAFWDALLTSLRSLPGATVVGAADRIPLSVAGTGFIDLPGREGDQIGAGYRVVSEDYFRALAVPLLAGRDFSSADQLGTERVTVINQTMAEAYWPGENPIGRVVRARSFEGGLRPDRAPWITIAGVVGDMRHFGHASPPQPEMYVLYRQVPRRAFRATAVIQSSVPLGTIAPAIRERVRAIDPHLAVNLESLDTAVDRSLQPFRFPVLVLSGFGLMALALASIGLYGVLSFMVAQRTREIAVRSALGARRGQLQRLVINEALRPLLAGAAAGVLCAWYASRYLEALLIETSHTDAGAFGGAVATLLLVGLAAAWIPGRRAARTDPMLALRHD